MLLSNRCGLTGPPHGDSLDRDVLRVGEVARETLCINVCSLDLGGLTAPPIRLLRDVEANRERRLPRVTAPIEPITHDPLGSPEGDRRSDDAVDFTFVLAS